MNDLDGLFADDFGLKPLTKSAPMAASKPPSSSRSFRVDPDPVLSSKGAQRSENFDSYGGFYRTKQPRKSDFGSVPISGTKSASGLPLYDKAVHDDDNHVLDRMLGSKSCSSVSGSGHFDDLLAGVGRKDDGSKSKAAKNGDKGMPYFDVSIPGFRRKSSPIGRPNPESSWSSRPRAHTSKMTEDPFVVLGSTSNHVASSSNKTGKAGSTAADGSSASAGNVHDDLEMLNSIRKSAPSFSFSKNDQSRREINLESGSRFQHTSFDMASGLNNSRRSPDQTACSPIYGKGGTNDTKTRGDTSPRSEQNMGSSDEIWLTVSEIPLFTQPTTMPPPSRTAPPPPARNVKAGIRFFGSKDPKKDPKKKVNESSSFPNPAQRYQSPKSIPSMTKVSSPSVLDELEKFAKGSIPNNPDDLASGLFSEEQARNSAISVSSAAMKAAMDRAEAKFRHAKELRGRESTKENDENLHDSQEQAYKEKQREEEEREQRRLEKERERAKEMERERVRQAVERATREARERAAADARLRAEKAALEKANSEVRQRTERAAVQRAQAEARERAANEAKERAEKAAGEAREREAREKAAEARIKAERAAVERATADVRQRATAEAHQKAAAAAAAGTWRANQHAYDNDQDSFFKMGSHPTNPPRPRASSSDPEFDTKTQKRPGSEAAKASAATSSNTRKASSTTNLVDDLSSLFGGTILKKDGVPPLGEFQELEGETEERRIARLERHQRTQERAAKALAEKNQRDLQTLKEQEERHRIAETLDIEIKRWAAGKEGNLRTLLSTLQYVLWPECGWEPVSLTDLIAAASVKKVYRKATLCIHPDKVQQKGANLQQKYIAEKVFDLLKEAWNKFNSEELF